MNIVVLGAGAIGGAFAGYVASNGHNVTAADEWADHVDAINREGLRVTGARGDHRFELRAVLWQDLDTQRATPDLVVICVKSYDTERAAEVVKPVLGPGTTVVSTQNGINEDFLCSALGRDRVIGAVTEIGGHVANAGHVSETRREGGFVIGELDGSDTARIRTVKDVFSACAPTVVTPTIRGLLWSKLVWNCMMDPLTAVTGCGQGELWTNPLLADLAVNVGREAAAVARADGASLEPLTFLGVDLPSLLADELARARRARSEVANLYRPQLTKSTSMREDIRNRRRTEIDWLNGHVVQRGHDHSVSAALNESLVDLVHRVERGDASPHKRLVESIALTAAGEQR